MISDVMAPKRIELSPVARSKVFDLWKKKEATEQRRITIDEIVSSVGLAKNTVRRFLDPGGDISGSPLSSVGVFAQYFGVGIDDVVEIEGLADSTEPKEA